MTRELVVISGKGGTGKTSITASFAALAENAILADCDVDAPDLHLVLGYRVRESDDFNGLPKAVTEKDKCTSCGLCLTNCRFDAIRDDLSIDPFHCEGCGVCRFICPEGAVSMVPHVSGRWYVSDSRHGIMVHACLGIAEGNSGKLVTLIRRKAVEIAGKTGNDLVIIDGTPGTGCPVIASITGASLALVVTEPTVSGIHDLERVCELTRHFRIRTAVCVNKADINDENTRRINEYCLALDLPFIGKIPYDRTVTLAQRAGTSTVEYGDSPAAKAICKIWEKTVMLLRDEGNPQGWQRAPEEIHMNKTDR